MANNLRVLIAGVEIILYIRHLPPLGLLFLLIESFELIIIASSSDVLASSSLSDSLMTISSARINIISSVGIVAGFTGCSSALISFLLASHLWSLNDFDLSWF